jgi:hypothetical protein
MTELVMTDLSREPWPCPYCEAGARIRDSRDAAKTQTASRSGETNGPTHERED